VLPDYTTTLGECYTAEALDFLRSLDDASVTLVLTSPPFALRRKKSYGNVDESKYLAWFLPYAKEILRVLKPEGSFVFELPMAWKRGTGTRSLFVYELILELCKTFHLIQEFYWYNPSRLPSPAQYVTIRRTRVKDAVSVVWWLGKTTNPKADNRRVLRAYSASMKRLFREGTKPTIRPSGHPISQKFEQDNGGAIPPNLLEIANTDSNDPYLARCREEGIEIHPARFPRALPEFFVRFLSEEGDLVVDPFAGSNVTGWVAQENARKWKAGDNNAEYVRGSRLRFGTEVSPVFGESSQR
jgi:site-specific DNA-methyltransferase (cytosine-N4-specific)